MPDYRKNSLWFDQLDEALSARPPLQVEQRADVAIVGAGFSGLWTAWYLKQSDPSLQITIVEKAIAGQGASGRNGGWLIGGILGQEKYLPLLGENEQIIARQLITGIPDHVEQQTRLAGINCDYHKGGSLHVAARYPEQERFAREELAHFHQLGYSDADYHWLDAPQASQQIRLRDCRGAIYTPHSAVIHPAKLVRGLAVAVEKLGVTIYEQSPVSRIEQGAVHCDTGSVRAPIVVRALEGYSGTRQILPVQSMIVATEPLDESRWQQIGLANRQSFSDASRLITYAQRSADNRLIFGARGGYQFGRRVKEQFDPAEGIFAERRALLLDLLPQLQGVRFTHAWGGTLGMARNFAPFALFNQQTGFATLGGYGGEGVGTSNLMARTLADLILQQQSELAEMPWALRGSQKQIRKWEPEPLPWLGYNSIRTALGWEERSYEQDRSSWQKRASSRFANWAQHWLQ